MTLDQAAVFAILALALVLFLSNAVRHDIVAIIVLVLIAVLGLVPDERVFAGFGHPAVLTVMAVMIIGSALQRAGVVSRLARLVAPGLSGRTAHIAILTLIVTVLSTFMNNVGALALMLPVALKTAEDRGRNPAILLMPMAFGSLLGGLCTLIGTPANIIVSAFRQEALGAPFGMFTFLPAGAAAAAAGVAFIALGGWRLLPSKRRKTNAQRRLFTLDGYLTELRLRPDSPLAGKRLREAELLHAPGIMPLGVVRPGGQRLPAVGYRMLNEGDVLILRADAEALPEIISRYRLEVVREDRKGAFRLDDIDWRDATLVEVVLRPQSPLIGRSPRVVARRYGNNLAVLAVSRGGAPVERRLRDIRLVPGDVVLIQGDSETVQELMEPLGLLPLAERGLDLGAQKLAPFALGVFACAVLAATLGLVSIGVAFMGAVAVYALSGILSPRDLYRDVDWPIIVLLGGMFPLGDAMQASGASDLIAGGLVGLAGGAPPWVLLPGMMAVAAMLSNVINNAATALLMAPIALAVARALDAAPDAMLLATALGASSAFLTPIGHQSNTLVMAPGGYRFGDYWRMGLPMTIIVIAAATPALMLAFPL